MSSFRFAFDIIARNCKYTIRQAAVIYTVLFLATGCVGIRHLEEGEKLLLSQKIRGNKEIKTEELDDFFLQTPNKKIPLVPFSLYVWLYHWGENMYDTAQYEARLAQVRNKYNRKIDQAGEKQKKINRLVRKRDRKLGKINKALQEGNQLMRWGEPVAVFDSVKARNTAERMRLYLETKGYFESRVTTRIVLNNPRTVDITYRIHEGTPYAIDSIFYQSTDTTLLSIIKTNHQNRLFNIGSNLDQDLLSEERGRIERILKNRGYYSFSRQYVTYDIDTSGESHTAAVRMRILTPSNSTKHKVFRIDSVIWVTDSQYKFSDLKREKEVFNGIEYRFFERQYSKKLLDKRLFIYPDSVYSLEKTLNTQRQLANLDVFKFINVNYDSTGGNFIANIFTSPLKKRDLSIEGGVNITEGIPGPFLNTSYRIRNFLKGLEILEISGRVGFDGIGTAVRDVDFTLNDFFNNPRQFWNLDARADLTLTFPQFILPVSDKFKSRIGKIDPKTTLRTGISITDRQNEYTRRIVSFNINYLWENRKNDLFNFSPFTFNYNNTDATDEFLDFLRELEQQGNNLIRSFNKAIVTSMVFTGVLNVRDYQNPDVRKLPFYIRYIAESGGTFQNFYSINLPDFTSYQFLRGELDIRRFLNQNRNIVFKTRVGIAYPYANNFNDTGRTTNPDSITLPYEKFFFIGGSNSIRAWRPRRLGPGSLRLSVDENGLLNYSTEKPGEFLLETSLEFRGRLFGFVSGAFFIDAGNVWTIRREEAPEGNPGSTLFSVKDARFIREMAVGTGVGIRLDFSFLLLRFDMGIQVHDPSRAPGERFVLPLLRFAGKDQIRNDYNNAEPGTWKPPTLPVFNLGVGFPF